MSDQPYIDPSAHVSEKAIIGKQTKVWLNAQFREDAEIGEYCMVGAGSVVTSDVKPYTLVVGNPAREIGKVCRCGTRVYNHLVCPKCGFDLKSAGVEE